VGKEANEVKFIEVRLIIKIEENFAVLEC